MRLYESKLFLTALPALLMKTGDEPDKVANPLETKCFLTFLRTVLSLEILIWEWLNSTLLNWESKLVSLPSFPFLPKVWESDPGTNAKLLLITHISSSDSPFTTTDVSERYKPSIGHGKMRRINSLYWDRSFQPSLIGHHRVKDKKTQARSFSGSQFKGLWYRTSCSHSLKHWTRKMTGGKDS